MEKRAVKVLMIAQGGQSFGGVENFFYQYYRKMDREIIHCDFAFCRGNSMIKRMEDPIFKESKFVVLGCFEHCNSIENYASLYQDVYKFLKKNKYDIVHINTGNIFIQIPCLAAAHRAKVPVRIAHSHSTARLVGGGFITRNLKKLYRKIMRSYVVNMSTLCFACGNEAGERLFGKKVITSDKYCTITNAFDVNSYQYDEKKRLEVRKAMGVDSDTKVIGTIGRLSDVKNPFYAICIFAEISELSQNTVFWMIGEGILKEQLVQFAIQKGIGGKISFLGLRKDIPNLLLAMDAYLMPSIYEGLGIAAIEAQAAGLACLLSDQIPYETKITERVKFLSINENPKKWAIEILNLSNFERTNTLSQIKAAGYDIDEAAEYLQNRYINIVKEVCSNGKNVFNCP